MKMVKDHSDLRGKSKLTISIQSTALGWDNKGLI